MALFNFQERFVPYIKDGTKTHTIRAIRRHPQKVGELMHLYTGLRTKWAQRIIEPQKCVAVKTIFVFENGKVIIVDSAMTSSECVLFLSHPKQRHNQPFDYIELDEKEKDELAWNDGFRYESTPNQNKKYGCFAMMMRWWRHTHELPFCGHINYWK